MVFHPGLRHPLVLTATVLLSAISQPSAVRDPRQRPKVHASAVVAPTAALSGDVTVGRRVYVSFGSVIVGDDGPVENGQGMVVRENVVMRGGKNHPLRIGKHVHIGAHAALSGCTIEDELFLATQVSIFHSVRPGKSAEMQIGAVAHVNSVVPANAMVPIGWIAVGDPATNCPPEAHEEIWAIQKPRNLPRAAYGIERDANGRADMQILTDRAIEAARNHAWNRFEETGSSE